EATAHLDSQNESAIQNAIHKLMQDRTVIIIAHRLSTIQSCDKIIVLEKGKIIEQGTHQALLNNQATYFNLVQMQQLQ
ncbi:MAG: ABC transporter ATP-binding protein, partial [Bacteroidetes bacterium]|nr:ABC transporter ATP-binding protein [Bacteroidota bacterium]